MVVARGWGRGGSEDSRAQDFQGSEAVLPDTMMADAYHYTFAKTRTCPTPRVNSRVNYELRVIMLHHCRLIDCFKWIPLVWDVGSEGRWASVGSECRRELGPFHTALLWV